MRPTWNYLLILFFLAGCMSPERGEVLETTLLEFNKRLLEIEAEAEKSQGLTARIKEDKSRIRKTIAHQQATLDDMRFELNTLEGRIEEIAYHLQRPSRNDEETAVEGSTEQIMERIKHLEEIIEELRNVPTLSKDMAVEEEEIKKNGKERERDAYEEARMTYKEGKYKIALEKFRLFLKEYPKSNYADNAIFWMGMCYFYSRLYKKAIIKFEEVISNYPDGNKVADALFHEALAFRNLGDNQSAKYLLKEVKRRYPKSEKIPIANRILKQIK